MKLFGKRKSAQNGLAPEMYDSKDMEKVDSFIGQSFGSFDQVFHEIVSPDIHVDICMIPPAEGRNYHTLVTMGMGAHKMNVPPELAKYKLERAELVITLPADWKTHEQDEKWYWPIRLLKSTARLPIVCDTWLGWGHTVDNLEAYAENTDFCGALLIDPMVGENSVCTLKKGESVNFYQLLPIYREEMDYKIANGTDKLLQLMADTSFVVDINRANTAKGI
ncbi:MAG TPA: hypothetical protein DDX91_10260 [Ruminococcaceae bacterium]|nr:hypothetical protein [Oscillospiraceae bacterium]